jgi:hypothetical protein
MVDRAATPLKNCSTEAGSVASKAAVLPPSTSSAARLSRSGSRPVMMTSAPSARARRALSRPIPALPPITTTVCPRSSGSRATDVVPVAVVLMILRSVVSRQPDRSAFCASIGVTGRGMSAICMRSAITAAS